MRRQEDLEVCKGNKFLSAIYQYTWVTTTKFLGSKSRLEDVNVSFA